MRSTLRLCLVFCLFATISAAAPKKKVPPPAKPATNIATEVAIKKTLDSAEEKVGACVLEHAGPGGWTLVVKAKLSINSAGQLLGDTVTFTPEGPAADKTRACIDGVLKALTWPKSPAPMVNAEREWTFSTESK
jgi:hypothetical protein